MASVSSDFQNEPLSTHKRDGCSAEVVRLEDSRLEVESVRSCDTALATPSSSLLPPTPWASSTEVVRLEDRQAESCDTALANPSSSLHPPTPWASSVPLRPELSSHTQQSVLAPSA